MHERLRDPIPRPESFTSRLRGPELTARIGLWLGIAFGVAFATGLISHVAQQTPGWLTFPSRPVSLYRVTQAVHVTSGTIAVPLLLVKLWSVYPRLFARPDLRRMRSAAVQGLERASIGVLVAAAVFQLVSGLANSAQWYPWHFSFVSTHYAVGWIAVGALVVHIAVKLPVIKTALGAPLEPADTVSADQGDRADGDAGVRPALTRRGLLRGTWLAAGAAALLTAGAAVPALRKVSVFAIRSGGGPQGVPINHTATEVRVVPAATDPDYRLTVVRGATSLSLSRADLEAMPQSSHSLPIACVEGWSASGVWGGVPLRDLLALVDAPDDADVEVVSMQEKSYLKTSTLPANFAHDPLTLLAMTLDGEALSIDHGYPCRLIAPDRPGVLQTKWVGQIEVLS
jgi:Oxidoreductase molybdopterin binding domain